MVPVRQLFCNVSKGYLMPSEYLNSFFKFIRLHLQLLQMAHRSTCLPEGCQYRIKVWQTIKDSSPHHAPTNHNVCSPSKSGETVSLNNAWFAMAWTKFLSVVSCSVKTTLAVQLEPAWHAKRNITLIFLQALSSLREKNPPWIHAPS